MAKLFTASVLIATAALVSGCGETLNVRKELGLLNQGPDEFTVVKRKPLIIPDELAANADDLPTPQPGAPSPLDPRPVEEAQRALTGAVGVASTGVSDAERGLLARAGATEADDSIRTTLEEDNENILEDTVVDEAVKSVVELVKGSEPDERGADPLDPAEEARRLAEEARASGVNPDLEVPEDD